MVESGTLLRCYTSNCIEGSNPSLSAMKEIFIPLVIIFMLTGFSSKPADFSYQNKPEDSITIQFDEDTWLIGLWEGSEVGEGGEIVIKLQLLPKGKSRTSIGFVNGWESGWLLGTYEIYDEVIVVTTNDVDVMYSFDKNKKAVYTASKMRLYKQ